MLNIYITMKIQENKTTRYKSKEELLAHYKQHDPKHFVQLDHFNEPDVHSSTGMFGGDTWELMHGSKVRVLIQDNVTPEEAIKMLEDQIECIKERPESITDYQL